MSEILNTKQNNANINLETSENNQKKNESKNILERYPDRIPIIVNKQENSLIPDIDKKKYLVPEDLTIGQFLYVIRKRIKLDAEQAIFLFVNGMLPSTSETMAKIYAKHKNEDGFLYITYSGENTFGK
tara:strand:- start:98 stop:481 length:384 start_codon:yes stop_codon:yes gene_type:complete